jgi:KUP system potassium uptake protein
MIMVTIMLTWHKGRELVFDNLKSHLIPLPDFLKSLLDTSLRRPLGRLSSSGLRVTACRMP